MSGLTRRFHALVLTLVFLGGGTSLPNLDVLLFHLHGERSRATAHVEPAGGCSSHDGHCALARSAGLTGTLDSYADGTRLVPTIVSPVPFRPWLPVVRRRDLGFQSRAPPLLHA